jgi:hypothetical protein
VHSQSAFSLDPPQSNPTNHKKGRERFAGTGDRTEGKTDNDKAPFVSLWPIFFFVTDTLCDEPNNLRLLAWHFGNVYKICVSMSIVLPSPRVHGDDNA